MAEASGEEVEMTSYGLGQDDSESNRLPQYPTLDEESNMDHKEAEAQGDTYEPTDVATGLGKKAAKKRLQVYGFNTNPYMLNQDPSHSTWPIFSLMVHTLASGLLSMVIYVCLSIIGGHWWQVGSMAGLLGFFLILAWVHTLRWRSTMRHMKKMLVLRSRVLRDGIWSDVPSRELVPGDIIQMTPGKIAPARCVVRECSDDLIVDCRSVLTDKHILTDISGTMTQGVLQIGKDEELPAGSMIKSGEAYRVQVISTGPDTFLHRRYDDGLVSNLRRARRKDLVYTSTRSLIILVFIVFVVAVGAALLTTILSDRQLAQVLATATFLIVFTAVHNPVGLLLRYARTEGARRVALKHGKRTGAALHSLTTVELLAAVDTISLDVRGYLASEDVKVCKVFPMKHCTASGLLLAAALATTPEAQAASSPLSTLHKAPVGDMEHVNMAILEELDVHKMRKLGARQASTDDALTAVTSPASLPSKSSSKRSRSDSKHKTSHSKQGSSGRSKPKSSPSKTITTDSQRPSNEDSSDSSDDQVEVTVPTSHTGHTRSRDHVKRLDEQAARMNTISHAEIVDYSSSEDDLSERGPDTQAMRRLGPRRKRPRTGSALRYSYKSSPKLMSRPLEIHAEADGDDEISSDREESDGNSSSDESLATSVRKKDEDSSGDEMNRDEVIIDMKETISDPKRSGRPPRRNRKRGGKKECVEQIETSPSLVHSSSSLQRTSASPYASPLPKRKLDLKGKDPCVNLGSGEKNPMELGKYERLGALFPPGCTVVHLQALSEEAVQYARESNPIKIKPQDASLTQSTSSGSNNAPSTSTPILQSPTLNRTGLKMAMAIPRDIPMTPREREQQPGVAKLPILPGSGPISSSSGSVEKDHAYSSFLVAKGDPRSVIRLCVEREDEALVNKIDGLVKAQCARGRTVVAVAKGPAASLHILEHGPPSNMNLVGLLCFEGEVMVDTSSCLIDAFLMGLNVKLITNDSVASASAFASKLGLNSNMITIEDYLGSDPLLIGTGSGIDLAKTDGFAEVTPENRIHLALAAGGSAEDTLVDPNQPFAKKRKRPPRALWGITSTDPSVLYEADVGVTHRYESDVAIQSADVVLMQPGLKSLTRAIRQARKTLVVLEALALVCAIQSLRNIITLVAAWVTYGFQPIPTTSLTILVGLNLPMLIAIAHFEHGRVTRRPPNPFMIRRVAFTTFAVTLFEVIGAFLFGVLVYDVKFRGFTTEEASSAAFLWFGLANGFVVLLCRSPYGVVFLRPWPSPLIFGVVFGSQVIATLLASFGWGMGRVGIVNALIVWGYTFLFFLIQNVVFYATRLIWNRKLERDLHSESWFMMWHKRLSETRWYRGLLTG